MTDKLSKIESQMNIYRTESVMSKDNDKIQQELLLRIKDLEMNETELQIENQTLKRQLEEAQNNTSAPVPKVEGAAGDQDLIEHIEFLNSIIADMHKKNLKLSKQIDTFGSGPSKSANTSFSGYAICRHNNLIQFIIYFIFFLAMTWISNFSRRRSLHRACTVTFVRNSISMKLKIVQHNAQLLIMMLQQFERKRSNENYHHHESIATYVKYLMLTRQRNVQIMTKLFRQN